jgi:hypothetical protein
MELNQQEIAVVEESLKQADGLRELCALELTLIGGGCGEVLFG